MIRIYDPKSQIIILAGKKTDIILLLLVTVPNVEYVTFVSQWRFEEV